MGTSPTRLTHLLYIIHIVYFNIEISGRGGRDSGRDNEEVVEKEEEIVDYFRKLYSSRSRRGVCFGGLEWAPIRAEYRSWVERPFEENEVRTAVEKCEGDKAPGPDGFTMEIFKRGWDIIKEDLIGVFNEFFENGIVNACTNSTYICLMP